MALEKEHPGADGADGVRSFWSRIAFRLFRKSRYRMSASQREADTADGLLGEREVTKESSTASAASAGYDMQTRVYSRRWAILVLFTAYSMSSAYQWIHVNIVFDVAKTYYNASLPESDRMKNLAIDFLSMAYMIAYIPLIFPANWLLDTKGLRVIGLLGSFLNALGAWLKCAAVSPDRFWLLMLAQTVCAIAQVFILGIPARLAAVWFGPNQVSTATAIGVFGNQLGVALGFVLPPYIVIKDDNLDVVGERFSYLFYGGAALTTVLFILVIFVFKKAPPVPPSRAQLKSIEAAANEKYSESIKRLVMNWPFIVLTVTYGMNTGCYYALGTLLSRIVFGYFKEQEHPHISQDAGWIGLTLVLCGLVGSVLAGLWLDKTKMFKITTIAIYVMSLAGMLAFTFTLELERIWVVYLCAGLLGLFMTGYLPVGFEFAAELTFPESEGTSSGILNASSQIFGIILTLVMSEVMAIGGDAHGDIRVANLCLCGVLFGGAALTIAIKNDLRRQAAEHNTAEQEKLDAQNATNF